MTRYKITTALPGEPLRDRDYSGSGFGLDVDEETLTGLLDWIIPPARAANGLAIGNIQICVENGEYRLSGLSIIDDDDDDDRVVVACESLIGGDDPGRVEGASRDVLSNGGTVNTIEVNSNAPDARVRLDLLIDGVSITGIVKLPRVGSPSCKKAKKVSSCSIAKKKKKTVRLAVRGFGGHNLQFNHEADIGAISGGRIEYCVPRTVRSL